MSTIERATGRWREILPQLGIESRFLINKHGPCPYAAGKTGFASTIATDPAVTTASNVARGSDCYWSASCTAGTTRRPATR